MKLSNDTIKRFNELNKDKIKDYAGVTLSAEAIAALKGIIFMSDKDLDY